MKKRDLKCCGNCKEGMFDVQVSSNICVLRDRTVLSWYVCRKWKYDGFNKKYRMLGNK